MVTPRTSLGSISLVNCRRWKLQATDRASAWARVVLPTPGTSSISKCPRARAHTNDRRMASGFPRIIPLNESSSSLSFDRDTLAASISFIVPAALLLVGIGVALGPRISVVPVRRRGIVANHFNAKGEHAIDLGHVFVINFLPFVADGMIIGKFKGDAKA